MPKCKCKVTSAKYSCCSLCH